MILLPINYNIFFTPIQYLLLFKFVTLALSLVVYQRYFSSLAVLQRQKAIALLQHHDTMAPQYHGARLQRYYCYTGTMVPGYRVTTGSMVPMQCTVKSHYKSEITPRWYLEEETLIVTNYFHRFFFIISQNFGEILSTCWLKDHSGVTDLGHECY